MTWKFWWGFGLLLWAAGLQAQTSEIDSLRRVAATTRIDSVRARSLCRLCEALRLKGQYADALKEGQSGLVLARSRGDSSSAALCLNKLANVYFSLRQPDDSQRFYLMGLRASQHVTGRDEQAQSLLGLGNLANNRGDYARADSLYRLSLQLSEITGNATRQARCMANLGILAQRQGLYQEALDYLRRSYGLREPLGDRSGMALVLFNIASIYQTQGQAVKALVHLHKALDMLSGEAHATLELAVLANLSQLHQSIGDTEGAEQYDQQAERMATQLNDRRLLAGLWINRSNRLLDARPPALDEAARLIAHSEEHATAIDDRSLVLQSLIARVRLNNLRGDTANLDRLNRQSFELAQQMNDLPRLGVCLNNMASRALIRGEIDRARELAYRALQTAQRHGDLEHRHQCAWTCYQVDSTAARWTEALAAFRLHKAYGDSLKNNQQAKQIGWLEARRAADQDLAQRDLAISRLEADRLRRNLTLEAQRSRYLRDSLLHIEELSLQENRRQQLARELELEQAHRQRDSLLAANRLEGLERERLKSEVDLRQQRWLLGTATGVVFFLLVVALLLQRSRRRQSQTNEQLRRLLLEISLQKTEIEAQSSEILSQRDQLEGTNRRMHALHQSREELINMIVHDLKNPLNAILGLAALPPEAARLTTIRNAGQQMSHLINNILDVQRYQHTGPALNLTPCTAELLVHEAVNQTDYLAQQKNIQFSLHTQRQLVVEVDNVLMVRVLVNLLTNAIKYAPVGDTLVVDARSEGGEARISITDHGKGIAPAQLERIFEKYAREPDPDADTLLPGTGLGLTFCRLAVEAHGGRIGAQSQPGQQTTFTITIPLTELNPPPSWMLENAGSDASQSPAVPLAAQHAPILNQLLQLPVYEITAILDLLDRLPDQPPALRTWKDQLERVAFAGDSAGYKHLIEAGLGLELPQTSD